MRKWIEQTTKVRNNAVKVTRDNRSLYEDKSYMKGEDKNVLFKMLVKSNDETC